MRKSNVTYVFYQTFNLDLLFWIVVDNLFLTTVKGLGAFDIVLVTMSGLGLSLLFYPLTNLIVKKTRSKFALLIGSCCLMLSITLFTVSSTILGFIIAQFMLNLSSPFRQVSSVMLKNNLKEQNKEGDFVKWQSYGKLGYSIITLIISLVAGFLFNVSPYLPMILSFVCTVVGLVFAIIYSEPKVESASIESTSIKSLLKNKLMLLVFLMNLFGVGAYVFMQSKATLLIQYVCQDVNIDLAKISLIVSGIVFGSRLFRVASNMVYPHIYKKVKNRSRILLFVSLAIVFSGVCFAIGANISTNYIVNLVIITIGFYIILSIRDIYDIAESRILTTNLEQSQQKQAVVLANIYGNCGRLFSNAFALLILNAFPLNILYIFILIFAVAQVFIGILLSKHLK